MFNFSIEYSDLIWGDKFNCIPNTKFLKIDDAYDFIKNNHSSKNIITHNGDIAVDEKFNSYINKFPKWYGQNIVTASPKFSPIPIGLENDYVFNSIDKKNMLVRFSNERSSVIPSKMLYVNHNIGTNPSERNKPYRIFNTSSWSTVEHSGGFDYQEHYYSKILDHFFMLSPPGNGIDCHRTWEILYLKRIPILRKVGRLEELYSDLPVVFIDNYEDISEEFLVRKYEEILDKSFNFNKIKFLYWKNLIEQSA
jgi:hypothetical protein